jgi:hypothetical protein
MNTLALRSKLIAYALAVAALGVGYCEGQSFGARSTSAYSPAYLEMGGALYPASLILFPWLGPESRVPLRPGLVGSFYLLSSSLDGRALYGVSSGDDYGGLEKLELDPVRQSVLPGSAGLGYITSLTVSPISGKFFVSAATRASGKVVCGDFEIDSNAGTLRMLRLGVRPDCGGPISPDGGYELHGAAHLLTLLNLTTGTSTPLGAGMKWATWSPDGRWIAAVPSKGGAQDVIVLDAKSPASIRRLGTAEGPVVWSPDSKYLLIEKSQISCSLTLYGASLQVIDVQTGNRSLVKSSKCKISAGSFFWMDTNALR